MTQPADWGVRFQDLATEAGQTSVRMLRRYQDLLERVARGELKPEQVQKQFADYLQEQAGTSTRELIESSVGLLAGLLHVEAKYREAMLDGLLPLEGTVPPPPRPAGPDLVNWFQALSAYASEQSTRAIARHQKLVDRVASGEISSAQVQEHGRRFVEQQSPAFLGEVMDLGLNFVGELQRASSRLTDGLYARVLGPEQPASHQPEPPICVDLRGPSGADVSACIVVENTRKEPAHVVCDASDFAARAFGRRFHAALEIAPARFTLAPGEQQEVTLRLPLDPSLFAVGADYVATVQISGAGERELIVQLMARAEDAEATGK